MIEKVIVIGGKGTSVNIAEQIIDAQNNYNKNIELIGFSNDDPLLGNSINGIPIICRTDRLNQFFKFKDIYFLFSLYRPDIMKERAELLDNLKIPTNKFTNFIHPSTKVNKSIIKGVGNIILSNCSVMSNVRIGNYNIINSNVVIEHDSEIGNNNFIAASCCIGSNVKITNTSFIGLNSTVRENIILHENSYIGMGSNVLTSTEPNCIVFGNPAKRK